MALSAGLAVVCLGAFADVASCELVVFTHGKVVKAASHQIRGDRIEIRLVGGGSFTLDRLLVERIEEDEVADGIAKASMQDPPEALARVEPSQAAVTEPPAPLTVAAEPIAAANAPRQNPTPPASRRHHRHRR